MTIYYLFQNTNLAYVQLSHNSEGLRYTIQRIALTWLLVISLYYHLSKYGQSFSRPTIFGIGIVLFSTLLWLTQPNPAANFSFQNVTIPEIGIVLGLDKINIEVAFERGLTNYLPSLSFGSELNVGLLDVVFKILGGAVTFGLIIIALRRKFERKFRHQSIGCHHY